MKAGAKAERDPPAQKKAIQAIAGVLYLALFLVSALDYRWHRTAVPTAVVLFGDPRGSCRLRHRPIVFSVRTDITAANSSGRRRADPDRHRPLCHRPPSHVRRRPAPSLRNPPCARFFQRIGPSLFSSWPRLSIVRLLRRMRASPRPGTAGLSGLSNPCPFRLLPGFGDLLSESKEGGALRAPQILHFRVKDFVGLKDWQDLSSPSLFCFCGSSCLNGMGCADWRKLLGGW